MACNVVYIINRFSMNFPVVLRFSLFLLRV